MTKFITGKGHFLKCVLKLKQNFKIIKRDSDNSSGKTHFSCECILHWILRRFCPGDTLWFSQFSRGRACQDCLFFSVGRGVQPCCWLAHNFATWASTVSSAGHPHQLHLPDVLRQVPPRWAGLFSIMRLMWMMITEQYEVWEAKMIWVWCRNKTYRFDMFCIYVTIRYCRTLLLW